MNTDAHTQRFLIKFYGWECIAHVTHLLQVCYSHAHTHTHTHTHTQVSGVSEDITLIYLNFLETYPEVLTLKWCDFWKGKLIDVWRVSVKSVLAFLCARLQCVRQVRDISNCVYMTVSDWWTLRQGVRFFQDTIWPWPVDFAIINLFLITVGGLLHYQWQRSVGVYSCGLCRLTECSLSDVTQCALWLMQWSVH